MYLSILCYFPARISSNSVEYLNELEKLTRDSQGHDLVLLVPIVTHKKQIGDFY